MAKNTILKDVEDYILQIEMNNPQEGMCRHSRCGSVLMEYRCKVRLNNGRTFTVTSQEGGSKMMYAVDAIIRDYCKLPPNPGCPFDLADHTPQVEYSVEGLKRKPVAAIQFVNGSALVLGLALTADQMLKVSELLTTVGYVFNGTYKGEPIFKVAGAFYCGVRPNGGVFWYGDKFPDESEYTKKVECPLDGEAFRKSVREARNRSCSGALKKSEIATKGFVEDLILTLHLNGAYGFSTEREGYATKADMADLRTKLDVLLSAIDAGNKLKELRQQPIKVTGSALREALDNFTERQKEALKCKVETVKVERKEKVGKAIGLMRSKTHSIQWAYFDEVIRAAFDNHEDPSFILDRDPCSLLHKITVVSSQPRQTTPVELTEQEEEELLTDCFNKALNKAR